jgi:hypothetical protein
VDQTLRVYMEIISTLKENLVMGQNHMKQEADQGPFECEFVEGYRVFLHLQNYKHTSLKSQHR